MSRDVLLNYTTTIDPMKSVGEITGLLVAHHATNTNVGWEDGAPVRLIFSLMVNGRELGFALPSNVAAVEERLQRDYEQGRIPPRYTGTAQASRVAWRILKDWVSAQIAIIETGMVRPEEAFLPYMLTGDGPETLYMQMQQRMFALPAPKERL